MRYAKSVAQRLLSGTYLYMNVMKKKPLHNHVLIVEVYFQQFLGNYAWTKRCSEISLYLSVSQIKEEDP